MRFWWVSSARVGCARSLAILGLVSTAVACSPKVLRLYPGPPRPANQVAYIEVPAGAQVLDVDAAEVNVPRYITELGSGDHRATIPVVEVVPGCHTVQVAYRARFRGVRQVTGPDGEMILAATAITLVTRTLVVPLPLPETHEESTKVIFRVEAQFEVELAAGYSYQPFATLVGEQFTPRLVVFAPDGERLGALPAAARDDGAGCSRLTVARTPPSNRVARSGAL